jgi:hypothetical protein
LTARLRRHYKAGVRLPYPALCALLGVLLGWWPALFHGPIPEKYDVLYIHGAIIVWAWYLARSLIGFIVGITSWPRRWWLRGPLCGVMTMLPLGIVSLATPACGAPCMFWNGLTGAVIGALVAGIAWRLTGLHRWLDGEPDSGG